MQLVVYIALVSLLKLVQADINTTNVFKNGESGYYCFRIPALVTSPKTGVVVAIAEGRKYNCHDHTTVHLVCKRSFDNGKTWTGLTLIHQDGSHTIGNPSPVYNHANNQLILMMNRNNYDLFVSYSDNDGATWHSLTQLHHITSGIWTWVAVGPPGGIQLHSGRIVMSGYHTLKGFRHSQCHVWYSWDHGKTWHLGADKMGKSPHYCGENQVVELNDGSVLLNARTPDKYRIQAISHDQGAHFGDSYYVPELLSPKSGCEASIIMHPSKHEIYVSNLETNFNRHYLCLLKSYDQGKTYKRIRVLRSGFAMYSSLSVLKDGHVAVMFEDSSGLVYGIAD